MANEFDIECRLDYEDWLEKLEERPIEFEKGYDEWCEQQLS